MAVTTPDVERPLASELAPEPEPAAKLAARLTDARGILAAVGLLSYVVLRLAYARFYEPFGLSPEDLGFDYVTILAQSAAGAIVVTAVAAALVAVLPMAVVAGGGPIAEGCTFLAACAAAFAALRWAGDAGPPAALALMLIVIARGAAVARAGLRSAKICRGRSVQTWWRAGLALMLAASVGFAGFLLWDEAGADARGVARGAPAAPKLWGVRLASWHAEAATVSWVGSSADTSLRDDIEGCVMYLGSSHGNAYLVRPGGDHVETLTVPASDVVVHVLPGRGCRTRRKSG